MDGICILRRSNLPGPAILRVEVLSWINGDAGDFLCSVFAGKSMSGQNARRNVNDIGNIATPVIKGEMIRFVML